MRNLRHHHPFVLVRLVLASLLAIVVAASASPASAGGWAVTSLDELPAATAGESVDVGFTILQHGQTPAVLDSGVGLELVLADGTTQFFEAVADGVPGHYVATVTFPVDAGSYQWRAHMDWFGTYELGSINVAAATSSSAAVAGAAVRSGPTCVGSHWPPRSSSVRSRSPTWSSRGIAGGQRRREPDRPIVRDRRRVLAVVTFATWDRGEDEAVADGPTTLDAGAHGAQLFRAKGCASCHDGPDGTAGFDEFPSLAEAPSWAGDRRPGLTAEEYVAQSIRDPGAFISPAWVGGGPITEMPQLGLTEAEIAAIVEYLLDTDD